MTDREAAPLTEAFREALMAEHADDWDMETVAEAAYICAAVAGGAVAVPPTAMPPGLVTDLESEVHQFMGHDGTDDQANDWVTDLLSALTPHIARAVAVPEDRPAPRVTVDDAGVIRHGDQIVALVHHSASEDRVALLRAALGEAS